MPANPPVNQDLARLASERMCLYLRGKKLRNYDFTIGGEGKAVDESNILDYARIDLDSESRLRAILRPAVFTCFDFTGKVNGIPAREAFDKEIDGSSRRSGASFGEFEEYGVVKGRFGWYILEF